ncbi:hypothetical protein HDU76_005786, partial [Blyttiomyces sp. JEL0837]
CINNRKERGMTTSSSKKPSSAALKPTTPASSHAGTKRKSMSAATTTPVPAAKTKSASLSSAKKPAPTSHFSAVVVRFYLHLPPCFIGNAIAGVHDYLNKFLMQYVPEVKGVLLSYSDVEILDNAAKIMYDSPFFHFHIKVKLLLFAPKVGSTIVGVVNKVSPDHIGLLVHGVFNASIPADHIRRNEFIWKEKHMEWRRRGAAAAEGEGSHISIKPGSVVRFAITALPTINGMLTLSGSLTTRPNDTGIIVMDEEATTSYTAAVGPVVEAAMEAVEAAGDGDGDAGIQDIVMGEANDVEMSEKKTSKKKKTPKKEKGGERFAEVVVEGGGDDDEVVVEEPARKKAKVEVEEVGDGNGEGSVKKVKKAKKEGKTEEGDGDAAGTKKKKAKKEVAGEVTEEEGDAAGPKKKKVKKEVKSADVAEEVKEENGAEVKKKKKAKKDVAADDAKEEVVVEKKKKVKKEAK